ncbi:MAG: hypothetical protein ABFS37_07085 [Acidobacteriota bacterium]
MRTAAILLAFTMILTTPVWGATTDAAVTDEGPMSSSTFAGLELRAIGPAVASGRIGDFAVDPTDSSRYFVAVASGGVWKTVNNGTTWTPVFDGEGSYSIGCVEIDPANPDIVWVGTGENNSQRSVSFGDGVYKSLDGGKNWKNLGLETSEHIGMITIDPRDTDVVYVAAQGPLWKSGGERGLYKTIDGGATWKLVLEISPDTGVNEVHIDPRHPDTLHASTYQRRRRVWALLDGGPESAIYKSTDAGETWSEALQINEVSGGCLDDDNTTEGAVPAVHDTGSLIGFRINAFPAFIEQGGFPPFIFPVDTACEQIAEIHVGPFVCIFTCGPFTGGSKYQLIEIIAHVCRTEIRLPAADLFDVFHFVFAWILQPFLHHAYGFDPGRATRVFRLRLRVKIIEFEGFIIKAR